MALIQWEAGMSVGVEVFDMQHQRLISIIRHLSEAVENGKGQEILGEVLSSLLEYTKVHFASEEAQFVRFGYVDLDIHKAEHDAYAKEILSLKKRFDDGKLVLSGSVLNSMSSWWSHHILFTDRMYSPFFKEQALE
jgi:hemerythrin-like metal-binding protein